MPRMDELDLKAKALAQPGIRKVQGTHRQRSAKNSDGVWVNAEKLMKKVKVRVNV